MMLATSFELQQWAFRILDGLTLGGLLFVLAAGFTLALGVMKIVNIAHGAFYLLASYVAWDIFEPSREPPPWRR